MKGKTMTLNLAMYPSKSQERAINTLLVHMRFVEKACFYYLKHACMVFGRVCSVNDLYELCDKMRERNLLLQGHHAQCLYEAADRSYQSFIEQIKNGKRPENVDVCGYQPKRDIETYLYPSENMFKVYFKGKKRLVSLENMPKEIKVRNPTVIKGVPRSLRLIRDSKRKHYRYKCDVEYLIPGEYR